MEWLTALSRLAGVILLGTSLGWYLGSPLWGTLIAALAALVFWSTQIWRLQQWLGDSSTPPPDLYGIWGEVIARIYKYQREATANQERLQSTIDYLLDSFSAMRDGVVIVEGPGGLRWCNEAAQYMLGLRYPDDIGQPISNIVRVPAFAEYLSAGEYTEPLIFETSGDPKLCLLYTSDAADD